MLKSFLIRLLGEDLAGRTSEPAQEAAISSPSPIAAIEAVEAAEFIACDPLASLDRFALLAHSIDAAVERGRRDMAAMEAIEATPRANGRSHGLEWAYGEQFVDGVRLMQVAALIRALAPHEAAVRALLIDRSAV